MDYAIVSVVLIYDPVDCLIETYCLLEVETAAAASFLLDPARLDRDDAKRRTCVLLHDLLPFESVDLLCQTRKAVETPAMRDERE